MRKSTVLLGLNELNFEFIRYYADRGLLPNFVKLFRSQPPIQTISEEKYELLEPWVQWVTIYTGKKYDGHKVFRLGDIVDRPELSQIFEELEAAGLSVGAVSPFNAENRLNKPSFFVPDPWTNTNPSGNYMVKALCKAVHQAVNDNAQSKLTFKSIISLLLGLLSYVGIPRWPHYLKLLFTAKKPGAKAIILDSFLADLHYTLYKKHRPDFSHLFLNAGAHIQHHYLFNSKAYQGGLKNPDWYCKTGKDPLIEVLMEYDYQIGRLLKVKDIRLIVATGLHQQPHEHLTYYWRLKEHDEFADKIGLKNYLEIFPRMSRDFLIEFESESDASSAQNLLDSFYVNNSALKVFKVDNRGLSLFVELVYPKNIESSDSIYSRLSGIKLDNFKSFVAFVAIKNGEHNGIGYVTSNFDLELESKIALSDLKAKIMKTAL